MSTCRVPRTPADTPHGFFYGQRVIVNNSDICIVSRNPRGGWMEEPGRVWVLAPRPSADSPTLLSYPTACVRDLPGGQL